MVLQGMMMLLLLSWSLFQSSYAKPFTLKQLDNSGILLEELGQLQLYHETWSIFTEINIEEMVNYVDGIEDLEQKFEKICTQQNTNCHSQVDALHKMIHTLRKRASALSDLVGRKRNKRSLFNGIGNGLHYLFGVMDNDNEEEVYSRIKTLENDQKSLLELEKHQISIVKSTFEQLQVPLKNIKENQARLAQSIEDLRFLILDTSQSQEIISALNLEILDIEFYQQTLIDIIISLNHNQIHPLLIPPSELLEIYRKTSYKLNPTKRDLETLLQTIEIKTKIMNGTLVARIILPRLTLPPFTLHKIHLLPIFYENYSLILDIENEYIASNVAAQQFTLFRHNTFSKFKKFSFNFTQVTYVGQLTTTIYEQEVAKTCPLNFVFNPYNETNPCQYLVKRKTSGYLTRLSRRNNWIYALPQTLKAQSWCRDGISSMALKGIGILTLNQPCHFQVNNQVIYFEGQDITDIKISQPPILHPMKYKLNEKMTEVLNNYTKPPLNEVEILKDTDSNNILRQNTMTLQTLESKLTEIDEKQKTKILTRHLPITSISLSSIVLISLTCYMTYLLIPRCIKLRTQKEIPTALHPIHSTTVVLQDLPNSEAKSGTTIDQPLPPARNLIPVS